MFQFPPEILMDHIAVLGKTGSGKTNTAKLIVEQVVPQGARVCILDPIKSDWWGLTSSASGKRPGLPFNILGGPHGHLPLHAGAGKAVAEVVGNGSLPLSILDMADFAPGGQNKFFTDFIPMLIKKMSGVVYLVLEEAHFFAPKERAGVDDENMSVYWAKILATAGRSKGLRMILVTQRIQALHNALLGSCETLIAHRLIAPADQKPIILWLQSNIKDTGIAETVAGSLSGMQTGKGWLCSARTQLAQIQQFPKIKTFDNTATPTDHHAKAIAVKTAVIDQTRLKTLIGEAVAEAEASDPVKLKREVAALRAQVAAFKVKPVAAPTTKTPVQIKVQEKRVEVPMLTAAQTRTIERLQQNVLDMAVKVTELAKVLAVKHKLQPAAPVKMIHHPIIVAKPKPLPPREAPAAEDGDYDKALAKGEDAILRAAAQFDGGVSRKQASILTGFKKSTRNAYISRLEKKGYVKAPDEIVTATPEGIAALGNFEPLPIGDALYQHWRKKLPEGERKILEVLHAGHPGIIVREHLDEPTGFKKSTRNAYISRLMAKNLVDETSEGVKASDTLFDPEEE